MTKAAKETRFVISRSLYKSIPKSATEAMIPALTTGGSLFTKLEKMKMEIKVTKVRGNLGSLTRLRK
jgi:hypothetical protein